MGFSVGKRAPWLSLVAWSWIFAVLIEMVTLVLRFGYKFESTRDTRRLISPLTFGYRIHHGYLGLVLLCFAAAFMWGLRQPWPRLAWMLGVLGWSLLLSDLIHHFLVLWPLTGSPQFDFRY